MPSLARAHGERTRNFTLDNYRSLLTASTGTPGSATASTVQTPGSGPSNLQFSLYRSGTGFPPPPAPVPSFDASLTFQWTVRDTTRAFN